MEQKEKLKKEFTDWDIRKTLIWKLGTLMSDGEYKNAKKTLIDMGLIKTKGKSVKITKKGLIYIQEEFNLLKIET